MQTLLVELAISMSEFKKNPAAVLRRAQGAPVAILNHNRVGFYMLEPQLFERMMAELARSPSSGTGANVPRAARTSRQVIDDLLSQAKAGPD
jgi:antitoxin StbD